MTEDERTEAAIAFHSEIALLNHRQKYAADAGGRVTQTTDSEIHCEQCGNGIPEARRLALPGVRLCISCKKEIELKNGRKKTLK